MHDVIPSASVYWVRLGTQGGCEPIAGGLRNLQRGDRIVCRTSRGLEIGRVLSSLHKEVANPAEASVGRCVRQANASDELLWNKLVALSREACRECQRFLNEQGVEDVLLEVEPLLDGKTLIFHFLGEPSQSLNASLQELANVYQASAANSDIAQTIERGCGPDCGTTEKSGCGTTGGCSVCVVANRCHPPKAS